MNLMGYLNDHLAGAAAGIQLAQRCRDRDPESELGHVLDALLSEMRHDREVLERVVRVLGGSPNTMKRATALGAERISSFRMWLPMIGPGTAARAGSPRRRRPDGRSGSPSDSSVRSFRSHVDYQRERTGKQTALHVRSNAPRLHRPKARYSSHRIEAVSTSITTVVAEAYPYRRYSNPFRYANSGR